MLLTDSASIRDVLLFPHMKPEKGFQSGAAAAKAAEASVVVGDKVKKGAKVLDDKGSVAVDKGSRALGKQLGKTRGMFKAFKDEYQKASGGSSKATK